MQAAHPRGCPKRSVILPASSPKLIRCMDPLALAPAPGFWFIVHLQKSSHRGRLMSDVTQHLEHANTSAHAAQSKKKIALGDPLRRCFLAVLFYRDGCGQARRTGIVGPQTNHPPSDRWNFFQAQDPYAYRVVALSHPPATPMRSRGCGNTAPPKLAMETQDR